MQTGPRTPGTACRGSVERKHEVPHRRVVEHQSARHLCARSTLNLIAKLNGPERVNACLHERLVGVHAVASDLFDDSQDGLRVHAAVCGRALSARRLGGTAGVREESALDQACKWAGEDNFAHAAARLEQLEGFVHAVDRKLRPWQPMHGAAPQQRAKIAQEAVEPLHVERDIHREVDHLCLHHRGSGRQRHAPGATLTNLLKGAALGQQGHRGRHKVAREAAAHAVKPIPVHLMQQPIGERLSAAGAATHDEASVAHDGVLALVARGGSNTHSKPAEILDRHETNATRGCMEQEPRTLLQTSTAEHFVRCCPHTGQRASVRCRHKRRPAHEQPRIGPGPDEACQAAAHDTKQLAANSWQRNASCGLKPRTVASGRLWWPRILAKHEQNVAKVQAHRLHLQLRLSCFETHSE
eukprot:7380587-Prymnesium_polylepis.2